MQYKFISNLLLVLLLNFLVKPFWIFGIDRAVQESVGAEQYGTYYALFSFSFLFNILLDLGITNYNNKNIAANHDLLKKQFSGIFSVKILLGVFYILISGVFSLIIGYSTEQLLLLGVLFFNQFLVSMILYLRSNISGLQYFKADSFISVLDRLLMILFCGVLLWGNVGDLKMTIKGFVYAQTLSYFITLLVALTAVLVHSKGFAFKLDFPFSKAIIKKSIPYALLVLLMTLYTKIDVVMIERMLPDGKTQAGIYAQGYRILEASNMIAFLFAGLLLPMFSKMLSNNEDVKQLVYLASKLLLYPSVVLVFCGVLFSNEIMELLYSYNTSEAAKVFGVLIVSFLPIASIYIYGTLLTAKGNLKFLNQVSLITLMLNVALNFYLIPAYGAYGAAQATLATQGLAALLQVGYAFKSFELQLSKEWILKIAILLLLCAVVAEFQETIQLAWGARLFVMIFIFAVYGFLGKFINIKDLHTILNEKR